MENVSFDKIKKEFIVDEEEYSRNKLAELMGKLTMFCKVTKNGQVVIMKKVPTRKILKLIISARLIAHAADSSISEELSREELKAYSALVKDNVFTSRLNDMLREKFAESTDNKKTFKAKNIILVEQFLAGLENE